jgi:WD40 repeat protein
VRIAIAIVICALSLGPISGRSQAVERSSEHTAGRSTMNDVAVKIIELAEHFKSFDVWGLEFSPDGSAVAAGINDTINIWDWREKRVTKTLVAPSGLNPYLVANPLRYSRRGNMFAICLGRAGENVFVRVWDVDTWSIKNDIASAEPGAARGASFSPDANHLIYVVDSTANVDNVIIEETRSWSPSLSLALIDFGPVAVEISPDGHFAAISGLLTVRPPNTAVSHLVRFEPRMYVLDLHSGKVGKQTVTHAAGPIAWSPDSARFAIVGSGYVEMFDARNGDTLLEDEVPGSGTMNARFTADGRYFIESDMDGTGNGQGVKIWDSQHHTLLQRIEGNVGSISVSRDSKYLAVGTAGRTTIWQFK